MKFLLATLAMVLSVGAAHATSVSWTFKGNLVAPESVPDLVGDVTITLDDENTAGSVKLTIDAGALADGEFIRNVFFTTDFNVEEAPFLIFTPPDSFPSYSDYDANEDGFNPIAGISADARINFSESPDPEFDNAAGSFEGVFTRDGLLVSDFLTNDGEAPYEIAIQAKGRPDCIDEEVIELLKSMGLFRLFLGVETNAVSGLVTLGRSMELADNHRALDILRRLEII